MVTTPLSLLTWKMIRYSSKAFILQRCWSLPGSASFLNSLPETTSFKVIHFSSLPSSCTSFWEMTTWIKLDITREQIIQIRFCKGILNVESFNYWSIYTDWTFEEWYTNLKIESRLQERQILEILAWSIFIEVRCRVYSFTWLHHELMTK